MEESVSYYGFSYTSKTAKAILLEALVPLRSLHIGHLVVPQTEQCLVKPIARSNSPIFLLYLRLVSKNPHQNKKKVQFTQDHM
jgi:hypothetical protein